MLLGPNLNRLRQPASSENDDLMSHPQFQTSPTRSAITHQPIDLNNQDRSDMCSRCCYSKSSEDTPTQIPDGSIVARAGLGFKGGVLPPMSPTPTPTPQPAPAPKEGPSFPSTLDLAGGRLHRAPLRPPPPPMPRARLRDAFSKHAHAS